MIFNAVANHRQNWRCSTIRDLINYYKARLLLIRDGVGGFWGPSRSWQFGDLNNESWRVKNSIGTKHLNVESWFASERQHAGAQRIKPQTGNQETPLS
jgi:hypothetical protein